MAEVEKKIKKRKRSSVSAPAESESPKKSSLAATEVSKEAATVSQSILSEIPRQGAYPPSSVSVLGNPPPSQCFFRVSAELYLSIAPMYSLSPLQGVRAQHLDPLTMTYFHPVNGIVLAVLDVSVDENAGARIINESPFAFAWVNAEFLVWRPKRGDILQGRINMQSRSHIGLLVCDVFNASITRDRIPPKWKFVENDYNNEEEEEEEEEDRDAAGLLISGDDRPAASKSYGSWVDAKGKKVDGKLTFVIEALETSGKLFSIEGSLLKLGDVNSKDLTAPGARAD
ncbi:hypothetical protein BZA70DRAFT_272877 [Myxozyma melibiosi]|uniref:DNA-directed RNA polymerase subunit n=1 Tax=Myxozyma melibiosi TaxID=54550 RepID=A0ABR1FDZ9_9ASCO